MQVQPIRQQPGETLDHVGFCTLQPIRVAALVSAGKTIAILLPDLRPGGAERVCLNLAQGFLARGYTVDLLLMHARGELLSEVSDRIRIVDLGARRLHGLFLPLRRYFMASRPAAVVVAMWPVTIAAILVAMLLRKAPRLVVSDHNVVSRSSAAKGQIKRWLLRRSIRWLYPRADAVVTVSHAVADDMAACTGLPRRLIATIHNPATRGTLPAPLPADDTVQGWRQPGCKRLITVGTLKPLKDQRTLIAAFAILRQQLPAKLLIIGEGPLRGALEAQVRELGISDDVVLLGFSQDPYPYYMAADLFVLTSMAEGFGNVLVEAMECGLPVVSTDCPGGPREILDDGQFGRLVSVGDADALAIAMYATLCEPPDVQRQRARAADFGVLRAVDAYLSLLVPASRNGQQALHSNSYDEINSEARLP